MNKNSFVSTIKKDGEVLAMVFRGNQIPEGLSFPTPPNLPIQIGWHNQQEERTVPFHIHSEHDYKINSSHEFLYVEKGWMKVKITDREWGLIDNVTLKKGDSILITGAGHEVIIGPETRVLEVKQGPYPGDEKAKKYK